MIVKVSPEDLGEEIAKQLKEWGNADVRRAVNEGIKETAETAAKLLRQGGPYQEKTGKYTKDWTSDLRRKRSSAITGLDQYSVHNKKHYQIAHLLEYGHQLKRGGRTVGKAKAYEHITPVNDLVVQLAVSNAEKKVRELN